MAAQTRPLWVQAGDSRTRPLCCRILARAYTCLTLMEACACLTLMEAYACLTLMEAFACLTLIEGCPSGVLWLEGGLNRGLIGPRNRVSIRTA